MSYYRDFTPCDYTLGNFPGPFCPITCTDLTTSVPSYWTASVNSFTVACSIQTYWLRNPSGSHITKIEESRLSLFTCFRSPYTNFDKDLSCLVFLPEFRSFGRVGFYLVSSFLSLNSINWITFYPTRKVFRFPSWCHLLFYGYDIKRSRLLSHHFVDDEFCVLSTFISFRHKSPRYPKISNGQGISLSEVFGGIRFLPWRWFF